jgi:hypothetical protein
MNLNLDHPWPRTTDPINYRPNAYVPGPGNNMPNVSQAPPFPTNPYMSGLSSSVNDNGNMSSTTTGISGTGSIVGDMTNLVNEGKVPYGNMGNIAQQLMANMSNSRLSDEGDVHSEPSYAVPGRSQVHLRVNPPFMPYEVPLFINKSAQNYNRHQEGYVLPMINMYLRMAAQEKLRTNDFAPLKSSMLSPRSSPLMPREEEMEMAMYDPTYASLTASKFMSLYSGVAQTTNDLKRLAEHYLNCAKRHELLNRIVVQTEPYIFYPSTFRANFTKLGIVYSAMETPLRVKTHNLIMVQDTAYKTMVVAYDTGGPDIQMKKFWPGRLVSGSRLFFIITRDKYFGCTQLVPWSCEPTNFPEGFLTPDEKWYTDANGERRRTILVEVGRVMEVPDQDINELEKSEDTTSAIASGLGNEQSVPKILDAITKLQDIRVYWY